MTSNTDEIRKEYNGTYEYSVKDFERNGIERYVVPCRILYETDKSYLIKILYPTKHRVPNQEFWVRKKSVYRSYKNNVTKICDKYNLDVTDESCRACLVRCFRKEELKDKTP